MLDRDLGGVGDGGEVDLPVILEQELPIGGKGPKLPVAGRNSEGGKQRQKIFGRSWNITFSFRQKFVLFLYYILYVIYN